MRLCWWREADFRRSSRLRLANSPAPVIEKFAQGLFEVPGSSPGGCGLQACWISDPGIGGSPSVGVAFDLGFDPRLRRKGFQE